LSPGSTVWQQDYYIPNVTTLPSSNVVVGGSTVVSIYTGSLGSVVQATSLSESVSNETWATGLTNWISPQFGAGYQLKLYAGPAGASGTTPLTYTNLPVGGSGNSDSWYFDYIAGIVNFADTNVPTAVAGNVVYVVGARYTGITGISNFGNLNIGNISINGNTINSSANNATTIVGNLTVTGNISFTGNVVNTTISGNSGQFFGNTAGFGAFYAGISTGYVTDPQTVTQETANFNGYAGVVTGQNLNPGLLASADIFLSPDNGTYVDTYLDMGIASSTYNYPGFSLIKPNDAYLFNWGNATTGGGNLIIGTGFVNDIVFSVQGINTNNEVMRITRSNVVSIKSTVSSTNVSSGALVVAGGVGIQGNLYAGSIQNTPIGNITPSTGAFTSANIGNISISGNTITGNNNVTFGGNITTGNINATTFYGNIDGTYSNFSSNVSVGNLTVLGNTNLNYITVSNLDLEQGNINAANVNSTFYGNSYGTVAYYSNNVTVVANVITGNTIGTTFYGNVVGDHVTLATGANIASIAINGNTITGNSGVTFGGNIAVGNVVATTLYGNIVGQNLFGNLTGNILTPVQAFITTVGNLGNLVVNNSIISNTITANTGTITGNLTIGGNINITGNAILDNLVIENLTIDQGNVQAGNVIASNMFYGNVVADTITPYNTPVTVFNSNTAIGIPVGTDSQRPTHASLGYIRYNTTSSTIEVYTASGWSPIGGELLSQFIDPDGVSTTYPLTHAAAATDMLVSINGVVQQPGISYTVVGTNIVFTEVPLVTDIVDVRILVSLTEFGDNVSGNLTIDGNVIVTNNILWANGQPFVTGISNSQVYTVSSLPSASSAGIGARAFVTDATSSTFNAAAVGGGSNKMPVFSNGTAWYIG